MLSSPKGYNKGIEACLSRLPIPYLDRDVWKVKHLFHGNGALIIDEWVHPQGKWVSHPANPLAIGEAFGGAQGRQIRGEGLVFLLNVG